jgi:AraC family transcriptional regulator
MTDSLTVVPQEALAAAVGLDPIPSSRPTSEQLASVRLRLLQAEEQLRSGHWRKAEEHLISARSLLDRSDRPYAPALFRGGLTLRQKQRLQLHIEQNLNRGITLTELAQFIGFSYSHFCRVFARSFGQSPLTYVRARRLERAKELMASGQLPLALIALECGLSDQATLCKMFRRITGETPAAWRRGQRT